MSTTELDYLNMSDEELMNAPMPSEVNTESVEQEDIPDEASEETPAVEAQDVEADTEDKAEPVAEETEEDSDEAEPVTEIKETAEVEKPAVDYKAAYDKLFTPFKANGKEIAIENVDDAISLMQMGANYNKKMAALKPNLKLMKLLENNGLLNEERISFLIDLEKKNPEAINKLVKDSGIDPMELDADKASVYKPNTYTVDDREMELDTVLDEIQGTPSYNRTLEIVSTKWDGPSKQVLASTPQLLKVINSHVQSGIYDTINKAVESERMFGRLNGLSDIEAYRQVGDAIEARGGFKPVVQGSAPSTVPSAPKPVIAPQKPVVDEDKLREKRRAAGTTKPAAATSAIAADFNPLALSDEEFSKIANQRFR